MLQPGKYVLGLLLFLPGLAVPNGHVLTRTGVPVPPSIHKDPGQVIYSAEFTDKNGVNIVYVSRHAPFPYGTPRYEDAIWVKQYVFKKGKWEMKWQIRDFAPNVLSSLSFDGSSFDAFDVDGDGVAETEFFYRIDFEGGDPSVLKYIFHYKDIKLAIRGTLPASAELEEYTKTIDPAFDECDPAFKQYASKRWDIFVDSYLKKFVLKAD